MKTYYIIGGVNGGGKSTFIAQNQNLGFDNLVDADKIAKDNNISNIQAGRIAVDMIDNYLKNGESFAQETILSSNKTLRSITRAKELGYKVTLYYIALDSADDHIARIKHRVENGGHDIKTSAVTMRFAKRFDSLSKILPYCDEAHLISNDRSVEYKGNFRNIAKKKGDEFLLLSHNPPSWFSELLKYANEMHKTASMIPGNHELI